MRCAAQVAVAVGALLALTACNEGTPVVSLDQARQITAMQDTAFEAPPRRSDELADKYAQALGHSEGESPYSKFNPANLEYAEGRIHSLRALIDIAQRRGQRGPLAGRLVELCKALWQLGRLKAAIAACQRAIASSLAASPANLEAHAQMVNISRVLGDIDSAERWMGLAKTSFDNLAIGTYVASYGASYGDLWALYLANARGNLHESRGQFREAELAFRQTVRSGERLREQVGAGHVQAPFLSEFVLKGQVEGYKVDVARVLLRQGRTAEAEAQLYSALTALEGIRGPGAPETLEALQLLSTILAEQGRLEEALRLAVVVARSFSQSTPLRYAQGLRHFAELNLSLGNASDALAAYRAVDAALAASAPEIRDSVLGRDPNFGAALLEGEQNHQALEVLGAGVTAHAHVWGERHPLTAEVRGLRAAALYRTGRHDEALAEFRGALSILFATREETGGDGRSAVRTHRLRTIVENYLALVAARPDAAAIGEMFRAADAMRARSVQRAVTAASTRAATRDAALADLVRREQDAKQQIGALHRLLSDVLSLPPGEQDTTIVSRLRGQIENLLAARETIGQEIARRFPSYAALTNPAPAALEDARRVLRPGEALIATYIGQEQSYVWAVPASGSVAFAVVPLKHAEIKRLVRELRKALDPKATTLGDIPAFDTAIAHQLYEALLKPVEAGWRGASNLLVVAQGPLGQIPFEVLVTEPYRVPEGRSGEALFSNYKNVPWLARKVAITWLPSVTSLIALRGAPPAPAERHAFVGFGDPWFNPRQAEQAQRQMAAAEVASDVTGRGLPLLRRSVPDPGRALSFALAQLPRLPDTADEVKSIGGVLGADAERDIFLGARATERRVKTMDLSNRRVVLFATHGLTAGDINGLTQPALAMTPPTVSGEPGDGLLTLSDVMSLRLNADWVVLSACNTGSNDGAGAEAVSGLGRGFFYAGARALLVTHWPVETTSAKTLTVDLFRRQAADVRLNRAQALRAAKLALIDSPGYVDSRGRVAYSYAHPLFWAPFVLVGDPGAAQPGS